MINKELNLFERFASKLERVGKGNGGAVVWNKAKYVAAYENLLREFAAALAERDQQPALRKVLGMLVEMEAKCLGDYHHRDHDSKAWYLQRALECRVVINEALRHCGAERACVCASFVCDDCRKSAGTLITRGEVKRCPTCDRRDLAEPSTQPAQPVCRECGRPKDAHYFCDGDPILCDQQGDRMYRPERKPEGK